MAFTGKYVSIDLVREKAIDMSGFDDVISKYQIAEMAWNLIARLGDPSILITRITDGINGPKPIEIINYRGLLPADLFEIINGTVRNYETKAKLSPTSNPYFLADRLETIPVDESLDDDFEFTARKTGSTLVVRDEYLLQDNEILTTLEEGYLEMSYKAFPLDDNGFPKVPDHEKVIMMLVYAVIERTAIKLWYKGKITKDIYLDIEQKYLYFKASASSSLKLRTIDTTEAFKNRHLRLNPDFNQYSNDFRDFGYPENYNKQSF